MLKPEVFWISILSATCVIAFAVVGRAKQGPTSIKSAQTRSPARTMQEQSLLSLGEKTIPTAPVASIMREVKSGIAAPLIPLDRLPKSLDDLNETSVRSIDLSVTAAMSLSIPVAGSVSGGYNRHVVVLEQYAVKHIDYNGLRYDYGYAIRFCITVSNWSANMKASLPFLAASAEIGSVQAQWMLDIKGLGGKRIREILPPPTELNVEKFVLVKQKLSEIISAMDDPSTQFMPELINTPEDIQANQYRISTAQAYALSCIKDGWPLKEALIKLGSAEEELTLDAIRDVYRDFAGLEDETKKPTPDTIYKAKQVLGKIKAAVVK